MERINRRKITTCILLSLLTLGIYYLYWKYLMVKNTRFVTKSDSRLRAETLCFLFVPIYPVYWWYTRGNRMREAFQQKGISASGSGTAYLLLSIFLLELVSLAIMQNDFNNYSLKLDQERGHTDALLSCRDLSLGYEGKAILEHLDFEVRAGDYLCVVGENGSGKSTLMKTILGLLHPLKGEVLTGDGLHQNEIGYLPQQTLVQRDFPASVYEIVLSGCQGRQGLRPFYSKADKALAWQNIRRMELEPLARRCYRELSGGQQQRVLLARALCATRKLLLLDEPVAGLDPKVTTEMYQLIADLNRKDGITVVMISHDLESALRYADHILHIGSRIYFGTVEGYLSSETGARWAGKGGAEA